MKKTILAMLAVTFTGCLTPTDIQADPKKEPTPEKQAREVRQTIKNDFGISAGGFIYQSSPVATPQIIAELGATCNYIPVIWKNIEPADDQWNFKLIELQTKTLKNLGMEAVYRISTGKNDWATIETEKEKGQEKFVPMSLMPKEMAEYKEFVAQVVEKGKSFGVKYYAIQNEINQADHWVGSAADYAELLKEAYATVKKVDPEAMVVENGFASPWLGTIITQWYCNQGEVHKAMEFYNTYFISRGYNCRDEVELKAAVFDKRIKRGIGFYLEYLELTKGCYDAYQLHFYDHWQATKEFLDWHRARLADVGITDMPLVAWEFGNYVVKEGYNPEANAGNIVKKYITALSEGVYQMMFQPGASVDLSNAGDDPFKEKLKKRDKRRTYNSYTLLFADAKDQWGLTTEGKAYSVLAKYCKDHETVKEIKLSGTPDLYGYQIESPQRRITMLWAIQNCTIDAAGQFGEAVPVDTFGNKVRANLKKLEITNMPIYLVETK
ncbi:MAG: hypothetical protein K9M45_00540 [Kiritimatiellales bacterium]|nr:hypothetical protein [Kiritimatiellales bacterium]